MSYIIESSLNLEFSNVFHAWASAFHAVKQPLIGNSRSLHASISDHFCATGLPLIQQAQTLPEIAWWMPQIQTVTGLHRRASLRHRGNELGLKQRFIADQTVRARLRR